MVFGCFIANVEAGSISFKFFAVLDSLLNHHFAAALFIDYFSAFTAFQPMHPSFSLLIFL